MLYFYCILYILQVSFYLFIYVGCAGSLLLHGIFSSCGHWGLLSSCGVQASPWGGFSCGAQSLGTWASEVVVCGFSGCGSWALEHRLCSCGKGLAAWRHVGSSWIRDSTCVSCIGRQILYHWPTRESLFLYFRKPYYKK